MCVVAVRLLLSTNLFDSCMGCVHEDDHVPIGVMLTPKTRDGVVIHRRRVIPFDVTKIGDPVCDAVVRDKLRSLPPIPHSCDLSIH